MLTVTHYYLKHSGGTKDYDLIVVHNRETDRAVLVQRWGKVNSPGHKKTSTGPVEQITKELWGARKTRERRGYRVQTSPMTCEGITSATDLADVENAFVRIALSFDNKTRAFVEGDEPGTQFARKTDVEAASARAASESASENLDGWGTW